MATRILKDSNKQLGPCRHTSVLVKHFDFGVCSETGYHDAGEKVTCCECGEVFDGEEWAAHAAAMQTNFNEWHLW